LIELVIDSFIESSVSNEFDEFVVIGIVTWMLSPVFALGDGRVIEVYDIVVAQRMWVNALGFGGTEGIFGENKMCSDKTTRIGIEGNTANI